MSGYVEGKDKNQILKELIGTAQPGSPVHEQQKMGILVRATEDMEKALRNLEVSMNNNAKASDRLSTRVFWLNVVLALATMVGAAAAVAQLLKSS